MTASAAQRPQLWILKAPNGHDSQMADLDPPRIPRTARCDVLPAKMLTRAQERKQQGKRDVTVERIQAYASGKTWDEEMDAAEPDAASEGDYDQLFDEESDYEEEEMNAPHLGRSRKRGRGMRARPGSTRQQVTESTHAVQRLPLAGFKGIGQALDFDTKLALSATCKLARETVFSSRSMDDNWIEAYARKRRGESIFQTDGSHVFALSPNTMRSSCLFRRERLKRGRLCWRPCVFSVVDLFRCCMRTHGGLPGFMARLHRRKRRRRR